MSSTTFATCVGLALTAMACARAQPADPGGGRVVASASATGPLIPFGGVGDFALPAGVRPRALAAGSGRIWVLDAAARDVLEFDSAARVLARRIPTRVESPVGLAFDGALLWVADEGERKLFALEAPVPRPPVPFAAPPGTGYHAFGAATWADGAFWIAIRAGHSSTISRIDPTSGETQKWFYANCDPVGLGFAGDDLYTLSDNGAGAPITLNRRDPRGTENQMAFGRRVVALFEPGAPGGFAWADRQALILDVGAATVRRVDFAAR